MLSVQGAILHALVVSPNMSRPPAHTLQSFASLVQKNPELRSLLQTAARLNILQGILDAQLEPAARSQCRVASFQNGMLLLILGDAAWATRLRYRQHKLLASLQRAPAFSGLTRILFKVSPIPFEKPRTAQPLSLPKRAALELKEAATSIEHPKLRAALERLATRTRQG